MSVKYPTIVIINGANWIGGKLVEMMLEQKGNVIVVDDFTAEHVPFIRKYSEDKHFLFIEKDKIETLKSNFTQIKYFIHLKNDFDHEDDKISSKYFIAETKFVDEVLTIALEKNSSYILTSSLHLHRDFLLKKNYFRDRDKAAYNESDLQDYIEKTVQEYVTKAGLNGRIVRLGNVYGPEMDLDQDELLKQILIDAYYRDQIRIYGDGLEFMYYVFITDAVNGIFKALFSPDTRGKIYSITNPEDISVLSIVNKILTLQPSARGIKFLKSKTQLDPLYERAYVPEDNISEIGWKPMVSFDRGIVQVYEYFIKDASLKNASANLNDFNSPMMTPPVIQPKNTGDLSFDFDDTINLTHRYNAPQIEVENEQFKEFYRKLNSSDSPIYNASKKRTPARKGSTKQDDEKMSLTSMIAYLAVFLVIYVFFIVPIFRLGVFFWKVDTAATKVVDRFDGTSEIETMSLSDEAERDLAGIAWALKLMKQEKMQDQYESIAKGIDNAILIEQMMKKNGLTKYVATEEKIPEASITEVQDVLLLLSSTRSQLEPINSINFPLGSNEKIQKIRTWVFDTEKKLSDKIQA